jgi:flagellar biosynthesis regulator FlaF|tara:strand:- start:117 stop:542 length:426 start_codon:yes stop_codon:yes gene_type:complete
MEPVEVMYSNKLINQKAAMSAYQRAQTSVMTPLQMEVLAFKRAAAQLKKAAENIKNFTEYIEALQFNQRLWTAIQVGLAAENCRVPEPVRSKMLNLSLFVDTHTLEAITHPNAAHLTVLIEIDLSLADGLFEGRKSRPYLN